MTPLLQTVLDSTRPRFNQFLHIDGTFLWISDFEIPYHDAQFLNKVFTIAKARKIRKVVWGGDALHLEAFSPFTSASGEPDKELREIDEYLPGFLEPFDEIYWFVGNHDERLARRLWDLGIRISVRATLNMLHPDTIEQFRDKVKISEYRFMKAGTDWLLEHPKNVSAIPGRVAQNLTSKFHKNAIVGHTHQVFCAPFNDLWAIETGCCVDREKLAYNSMIHGTRPQMEQGAVLMFQDEWGQYTPIPLYPKNIDHYLSFLNESPVAVSPSLTAGLQVRSRSKK